MEKVENRKVKINRAKKKSVPESCSDPARLLDLGAGDGRGQRAGDPVDGGHSGGHWLVRQWPGAAAVEALQL